MFGERAGQPPLRLVDPSQTRPDEPIAIVEGFNVHAARTLHGADHAQVERLVRYHGVLSAHANLRPEVVPEPPEPESDPLEVQPSLPLCVEPEDVPRRKPWAWLLKHVFEEDVSVCPRCQGPTTWLEVATEPDAIDRALVNHGLAPPRAPPPPLPQLYTDAQLTLTL